MRSGPADAGALAAVVNLLRFPSVGAMMIWLGVGAAAADKSCQGRWRENDQRFTSFAPNGGKIPDGRGETVANRQSALDRLRNAMLEEDPAKRPSLDAMLLNSYSNGVG